MTEPYFTSSDIKCEAPCSSLQNAWNDVINFYNDALGYEVGVGNPSYLTEIPLPDAHKFIVNANLKLQYLRGIIRMADYLPNKSQEFESLLNTIKWYLPNLDLEIKLWLSLLNGSLTSVLDPERWQRMEARRGGLRTATLERLAEEYPNVYGPNVRP